jgi:hypothetical protein
MDDFDDRIGRFDLSLFSRIESQSTANDRQSLLAVQLAVRQRQGEYCWLEIGSHLGGSLQALMVDPRCARVLSIDPRPLVQPDERGQDFKYAENSTQRMLELLGKIPAADLSKIRTFDAGTDTLRIDQIGARPDVCFIDGEHTDAAVLRDARFCLSLVSSDGCIAFHDAQIIYRGLLKFVQELSESGRNFRAYNLPDSVFVVELGGCRFSEAPHLRERLANNHLGYLWSLMANDEYREACRRPWIRALWGLDRTWRRVAWHLSRLTGGGK